MARIIIMILMFVGLFKADNLLAAGLEENVTWGQIKAQSTGYQPMPAGKVFSANAVAGRAELVLFSGGTVPFFVSDDGHKSEVFIAFGASMNEEAELYITVLLDVEPDRYQQYTIVYRYNGDKMEMIGQNITPGDIVRSDGTNRVGTYFRYVVPYIGTDIQKSLSSLGVGRRGHLQIIGYP